MAHSPFSRRLWQSAAVVLSVFGFATVAPAQEVRLVSTDGFIDFTGTLVSFEDGVYVLESNMGRLTFPATEVSCEGEACPQTNEVASAFGIVGSPTMIRFLLPELLDSYSLDADTDIQRSDGVNGGIGYQLLTFDGDPVADVSLNEAVSDDAINAMARGDAALAILPTRMSDGQAERLGTSVRAMARQGFETPIAADALAVVIGNDVGIEALRIDELAEIIAGQITNWSELGGPDLPISVFTEVAGTDVHAAMLSEVLEPLRKRVGAEIVLVETSEDVADAVDRFPNGIGIGALSQIGSGAATVGIANACDFAVQPSEDAVKTGRYPLPMGYHIYTSPNGVPVHARGLVDFAGSVLGQELVSDAGYFNLSVDVVDESEIAYGAVTENAQPLSLALTVASRGAPLDAADTAALERLASLVRSGRIEGNEIVFLGVAEPGDESDGLNAARTSLRAFFAAHSDIEEQLTVGFGFASADATASRAACIDNLVGETRVEVWLRPLPTNG